MGRVVLAVVAVLITCGVSLGQGYPDCAPVSGAAAPMISPATGPQPSGGSCAAGPSCPLDVSSCPSTGRFWIGADYLLWQVRGDSVPALVTTSPPGTARTGAGVLSSPGTSTLFGDSALNNDWRSGFRLDAGGWLDCDQKFGVEADFFILGNATSNFNMSSDGNPILARPFFNVLTGMQDSELIAYPGVLNGQVAIRDTSSLLGTGVWARCNLCCSPCYRLDALLGYRYLRLADNLGINENLTSTDPTSTTVPLGTRVDVSDEFDTMNNFNGVDLGLAGEWHHGNWVVEGAMKVALGVTNSEVDVNGSTTIAVPGFAPLTQPGGLLALSSNSGRYSKDRFSVVPEAGIKLGYDVTPHVRVAVGYDFLYWTDVMRPGGQIDTVVNPNLLAPATPGGPARPMRLDDTTDIWVQGVSFSLEFRF
jgi:hypothetical protein